MWFGYSPQVNFCHFFLILNLLIFKFEYCKSINLVGTLCAQITLQFYADRFKTLQVFLARCKDVHVIGI